MPQVNGIYTTWVLVRPAEDLPGTWIAHALDFDVVSYGDSAQHSLQMVAEAIGMVLIEDLQDGHDPHARRAPAEYWERLQLILEHGERFPMEELQERVRAAPHSDLAVSMWVMPKPRTTEESRPSIRTPIALSSPAVSCHA